MAKPDPKVLKNMSASNAKAVKKAFQTPKKNWTPTQKSAMNAYNKRKTTPDMKPAKTAGQAAAKPGGRPTAGGGAHQGDSNIYGKGGKAGWMDRWNNWFKEAGLPAMSPEEFAKTYGITNPPHVPKNMTGLEGSTPADIGTGSMSEAGKLAWFNTVMGTQYGDMQSMMADLGPEFSFAGAKQFQLNQSGDRDQVLANPSLQNVGMQDPWQDPQTASLLQGALTDALSRGGPQAVKDLIAGWGEFAPPWAQEVADKLHEGGTRFSTELFGSPGVNWMDENQLLFGPDVSPASLSQLTGFQRGEEQFLRGMSAREVMEQLYPSYSEYYNREAGAPAPHAGFQFGVEGGGAMRGTDAYQRWGAYGQPGNSYADEGFEGIRHAGATYDPFGGGGNYAGASMEANLISQGLLKPEYLAGSPQAFPDDLLMSWMNPVGAAAYGRPDLYFQGPRAPYAPDQIGEAAMNRLRLLAQAAIPSGMMQTEEVM